MAKATAAEIAKLDDELGRLSARNGKDPKVRTVATKLLSRAATLAYAGYGGLRETAELRAIECLARGHRPEAKRVWMEVVANWTAASPLAGKQAWYTLAKLQGTIGAKVPTKLRTAARKAWATGRFHNVYTPTRGVSKATPPKVPAKALEQACIEIGLRQFERARACAVNAARKWKEAELLEFVICMEEDRPDSAAAALESLRALAKKHARTAKYEHWETICAALVLLDDPDAEFARRCLAAWKATDRDAPTAMLEG